MAKNRVLVVEDDNTLLSVLEYNLAKEGYSVLVATDGVQALEAAEKDNPDLVILDVMLPKMSGLEVCRILRGRSTVPILLLTARSDVADKIAGLDLGADDYLTKPFSMRELLARARAMLRRTEMAQNSGQGQILRSSDIVIDIARHAAATGGVPLELSPKEFDLLAFLVKNHGIVFTREQLLEKVWGYHFSGDTRTVDVHVRWLREKIEKDPGKPSRLVTIRGIGYKLEGTDVP